MEKENFNDFVKFILKKPGMFGVNNLYELYLFMEGYCQAILLNSIKGDNSSNYYKENFNLFVQDYYNHYTTEGWVSIIEKNCKSIKESFERFESLFLEFITE